MSMIISGGKVKGFMFMFLIFFAGGWLLFSESSNVLIYSKYLSNSGDIFVHYCGRTEKLDSSVYRLKHSCEGKVIVTDGKVESDSTYITPGVEILIEVNFVEGKILKEVVIYSD